MNKKIEDLLSTRDSRWRFPGDVYDTFKALTMIAHHDKSLLDGEALGAIMKLLILTEQKPGGPYYSHFEKNTLRTIDARTNKMIARFLALYDVALPNLSPYLGTQKSKKKTRDATIAYSKEEARLFSLIRKALTRRFKDLDPEFRSLAFEVIDRTIAGNPDKQMSLMPYYMKQALGSRAKHIPESLIVEMGVMNIFFWTAFIIYDDFWDEDEAALPRLLPVANLFARSFIHFFDTVLPDNTEFRVFFHSTMDDLDMANTWETMHCRANVSGGVFSIPKSMPLYGDYTKKYRPASGHIMGPLALLLMCGSTLKSPDVKNLIAYFKHYLIAMQINDDMHDWEEDMQRGNISTVVDILLGDLSSKRKAINLVSDKDLLQKTFWFTTLTNASLKSLVNAERSRKALYAIGEIEDRASLEQFIIATERVAHEGLHEQKKSIEFISSFSKTLA